MVVAHSYDCRTVDEEGVITMIASPSGSRNKGPSEYAAINCGFIAHWRNVAEGSLLMYRTPCIQGDMAIALLFVPSTHDTCMCCLLGLV